MSQEVKRRMFNCDQDTKQNVRREVLDTFSDKLRRSGYSLEQRQDIINSGLVGYVRRRDKAREEGTSIHRGMQGRMVERRLKKAVLKKSWFKKSSNSPESSQPGDMRGPQNTRRSNTTTSQQQDPQVDAPRDPDAVLFVNRTPRGALLSKLKEVEKGIQEMTTTKIRIVEQAGQQLRRLLCTNDPWRKRSCERDMCSTCRGPEKFRGTCYKRNVVYQDICVPCQEMKVVTRYIGESSRSLYERGLDHRKDARDFKEISHIRSHVEEAHPELLPQLLDLFRMEPLQFHRSALDRLVMEALLIAKGQSCLLNKKEEYVRNSIPVVRVEGQGGRLVDESGGQPAQQRHEEGRDDDDEDDNLTVMRDRKRRMRLDDLGDVRAKRSKDDINEASVRDSCHIHPLQNRQKMHQDGRTAKIVKLKDCSKPREGMKSKRNKLNYTNCADIRSFFSKGDSGR